MALARRRGQRRLIVYIDEPTTLLSNLLLSVVTLVLGVRLLRQCALPARLWAGAYLCVSAGALVAGACHGFESILPRDTWWALWRAMLYLTTAGVMLSAAAVGTDPLSGRWAVGLVPVAAVGLLRVGIDVTRSPDFAIVMRYAGVMAAFMLAVLAVARVRHREPRSAWMAVGVFVAILGGVLRATNLSLEPFLNANDLYHVIQVGAFDLIFRGASTLDRGPAPASSG